VERVQGPKRGKDAGTTFSTWAVRGPQSIPGRLGAYSFVSSRSEKTAGSSIAFDLRDKSAIGLHTATSDESDAKAASTKNRSQKMREREKE
jgi:hypothetical protein